MINWQVIDTVLLDMDGTILDLAFDNFFWLEHLPEKYAEKHNISLAEAKKYLADNYAALTGKLQWYCLDHWSDKLQIDIVQLKQQQSQRITFRPNAKKFLAFLTTTNKKIYLATNAHPKSVEIKMLSADFQEYFTDINSSHEFGYAKEEQQYWQALQKKYQFNPQTTLFIDDNIQVLKSARQFGIKYLLAIAQPDMSREKVDCSPFTGIDDFQQLIDAYAH